MRVAIDAMVVSAFAVCKVAAWEREILKTTTRRLPYAQDTCHPRAMYARLASTLTTDSLTLQN